MMAVVLGKILRCARYILLQTRAVDRVNYCNFTYIRLCVPATARMAVFRL